MTNQVNNNTAREEIKLYCQAQDIVDKYGFDVGAFIQNIRHWTKINFEKPKNKNIKNIIDGYCWSFISLEKLQETFKCWTISQLKTVIKKAVASGLIIKGSHNDRKYDRTTWYALSYEAYKYYPLLNNISFIDQLYSSLPETDKTSYANFLQLFPKLNLGDNNHSSKPEELSTIQESYPQNPERILAERAANFSSPIPSIKTYIKSERREDNYTLISDNVCTLRNDNFFSRCEPNNSCAKLAPDFRPDAAGAEKLIKEASRTQIDPQVLLGKFITFYVEKASKCADTYAGWQQRFIKFIEEEQPREKQADYSKSGIDGSIYSNLPDYSSEEFRQQRAVAKKAQDNRSPESKTHMESCLSKIKANLHSKIADRGYSGVFRGSKNTSRSLDMVTT